MLKAISNFFHSHIRSGGEGGETSSSEHRLRLATAALLIEMTRADFNVTDAERAAVDDALRQLFGLSDTETRELVALAEREVGTSASLFQFTHLIDQHMDLGQKIEIIELLWRVAYSDACKDMHEEHLVRKIADLLHVPHTAYIQARERVAAGR